MDYETHIIQHFRANVITVLGKLIAVLFCSSTLLSTASAQSSSPLFEEFISEDQCKTIRFLKKQLILKENRQSFVPMSLGWVRSAVWDGPAGLRAVDVPFENLRTIDLTGTVSVSKAEAMRRYEQPYHVAPTGDGGYVVMVYKMSLGTAQEGFIRFFDRDGKLTNSIRIDLVPGGPLASVFALTAMADGVLAFGWRRLDDNNSSEPALVYFSRDGSSRQIIANQLFDGEDEIHRILEFYLLQFHFLTGTTDAGYVLVVGRDAWIGKIDADTGLLDRLKYFPDDFGQGPILDRDKRWHGRPSMSIYRKFQFHETIQHTRMPVGIYAWKERLFVLAKEAMDEDSQTLWRLIEVDPADGSEISSDGSAVSRNLLPTMAQDIVLVPGDLWAILQRGPIEVIGSYPADQLFRETSSMVVFPGRLLDRSEVLLKHETPLVCDHWDSVESSSVSHR